MSGAKYNIVFGGKIRDGADLGQVKENVARLFKIDATKVERLFTGSRVVLKADVDKATADKYEVTLAKAGAIVGVEPLKLKSTILAPEEPSKPADLIASSTESADPVSGKKKEAEMDTAENFKNKNFFIRLIEGDIPLPITYWVFGVFLCGFCVRIILSLVEENYLAIATQENGPLILKAIYWGTLLISGFFMVAIWNSASKYEGKKIWSTLAKAVVIINILTSLSTIERYKDTNYSITSEIQMINKSLPVMIDNGTRLDDVSFKNNEVSYNYTLVAFSANDINKDRLASATSTMKASACKNPKVKLMLKEGYIVNYVYRDKLNNPILKIPVSPSDCF